MGTSRKNGSLYTRIDGKVAHVEFGHPGSNSFVADLLLRLTNTINELSENEGVSVILLKSEGEKAFCAGASFDELLAVSNLEEGKAFFSGFAHVINAMRKCKKVIVGRVHAALAELSLAPTEWKSAYWAQEKGLFSKVYESVQEMDKELDFFIHKLASYNADALTEWKKVLWEGTDHWDILLTDRAAITGKLALSDFTRNALSKFKK